MEAVGIPARRSTAQRWVSRVREAGPYVWLIPALGLFLVFRLYPVLYGMYLSLHTWDGIQVPRFVGLENFAYALFTDDLFRMALMHNVLYAIGTVTGKNVLALFLAVLLNVPLRGRAFFRTTLFMPVVMSFVVVGILWTWMYNTQFGLINAILGLVGIDPVDWVGDPKLALWALMGVDIWKWYGYHMVIFLAGLQGIPVVLYEAARVDGAGAWRQFWNITVPMLRPIIGVSVTLSLMGAFNVFDIIYVMTQGGPNNSTLVVVVHSYLQGFKFYRMGYGATLSVILLVIVIIASAIQIRLMRTEKVD